MLTEMRLRTVGMLAMFLALAVFWTWPLAPHLSSRIAHDNGDPVLNTWILWWNAHTLPFTDRWWNPPMFHPVAGALALSEHLAGIALVTTPLQWTGVSAVAAYNIALILSFASSGFFAWLLVDRLLEPGGSARVRTIAGLCAGLSYGFGPYRAGQLAHLQVLTSQWMPLALLAMHAHVRDGRRRWLALFAGAWLVQALSNGYYLLFFPVLIGLWLAWFVDWRHAPRRGVTLAAAWAAASLPLVPLLLKYADVHRTLGLGRTGGERALFSATPDSFVHASGMLAFWPASGGLTTEAFLFPGVTALALVAAACAVAARRSTSPGTTPIAPKGGGWRPPPFARSPLVFYAGAAAIMWALAFGPAPPGALIVRPYDALAWLPGFDALRVPARFAMLATLCLSIAAGLAFARVAPARPVFFTPIAACALAGLAVDGWTRPMPLAAPPPRVILPDVPGAVVLELPVNEGAGDAAAMYRSMLHGRPIVNGYSGHAPPAYAVLAHALQRGDPTAVTELARGGPLLIVLNRTQDSNDDYLRLVESLPGIQAFGGSSVGPVFALPPQPPRRDAPLGAAWPASMRESGRNGVVMDLGEPRVVRTIGFAVGSHARALDPRLAVEASVDGAVWSNVWENWIGGAALDAARRDPREIPVRLTVPDITARYLRVHPAPDWLAHGLKAFGPH